MIKKILTEESWTGFFKGLKYAVILVANPVIQFIIYEQLKKNLLGVDSNNISYFNVIWITFVSKLITSISTYPLLTIKTLLQSNKESTTDHIWALLAKLWQKEGILGYFKGFETKILQTLLNNIILMTTYEKIQNTVRNGIEFALSLQ